jgi:hypothetical protein
MWGDTERVVARWQRPVASSVAVDMLHQAMRCALHHCVHMAIEMTHDRGTFKGGHCLFCLL